jgi:hypothetical protein
MINKGDLFQGKAWVKGRSPLLIEVVRTYNKRDIDYDCPESVAIIGMVEAVVLSGPDIGKIRRYQRSQFHQVFLPVEEAS